jgi:hypothetical protein
MRIALKSSYWPLEFVEGTVIASIIFPVAPFEGLEFDKVDLDCS